MTLVADNAIVGITGAVRLAPFGTTLPTDAVTALAAAYIDLGYISEEGVSLGVDDSVENKFAWQSATLIRSIRSSSVTSLNFAMIEQKGFNLEFWFPGSQVTEDTPGVAYSIDIVPPVTQKRVVVLDIVDDTKSFRWAFGNAELVSRGEIPISNQDLVMFPVTMNFYPDDNGNLAQAFSNDPAWGSDITASLLALQADEAEGDGEGVAITIPADGDLTAALTSGEAEGEAA